MPVGDAFRPVPTVALVLGEFTMASLALMVPQSYSLFESAKLGGRRAGPGNIGLGGVAVRAGAHRPAPAGSSVT